MAVHGQASWGSAAAQLEFPVWSENELCSALTLQTGLRVELVITDNASTLMSVRHKAPNLATVRVHHMFLSVDPTTLKALARWVKYPGSRAAGPTLNAFIAANNDRIREAKPRVKRIRTQGELYDLQELYNEVNAEHFDNRVDAPITWGKRPNTRKRRRSIRFGSYSLTEHLIRMHPNLDQAFVPRYFIRYIVFHEMLHADLGFQQSPSGRTRMHTPEFNRIEREYPDFDRAVEWHNNLKNLRRMLRK
jgi:predicted metal-dependent hydrolase